MNGARIGTIISAVGYVLAIIGGWILYKNSAPESGMGRIPVTDDMDEFFKRQDREIASRRVGNRTGFGLLTVGSCLQLLGTVVAGLSG